MSKGFMKGIALLLALCMIGGPFALADAPYSVQAGTDTAYIGTDSRVWLYNANKAVSEGAAMQIVGVNAGAVYYLDAKGQLIMQPLEGGESGVLASGVYCPVDLNGTFFYLDAADHNQVFRVASGLSAQAFAQGSGSGDAWLRVDDGRLFFVSDGKPYEVNLANGELTESASPLASDIRPQNAHQMLGDDGVLRVRDANGQLHAIPPASDDAEDAIRGAALLNGMLFYVVGGQSMTLMGYDFAAASAHTVGALPDGFSGVLIAQDGKLFGTSVDLASDGNPGSEGDVVEVDPTTAQTTQVGHFTTDDEAPVLASMPGVLALYSSGEGAPKLLASFPINPFDQSVPTEAPILDEDEDTPDVDAPEEFLDGDEDEDIDTQTDSYITIAPSATLAPTRRPDKTAGPSGYASLTRGDHGELVRKLQKRLVELGYLAGGVDGDFGYNTQQAIKAFQKKLKLEQDGVASIELQKKLFAKDAPKAALGYTELEKGDKGTAVKDIQTRLKKLGYYAGPTDGKFTNQLQTAVKLFQKTAGLKQTGKASVETQKKLFGSSAPKYSLNKLITLRPGDSGERVKNLQRRLKKLGYFTGSIGGNYQTLTTKAVKRFQKQIGEKADGVATVELLKQIFDDDAPEYDG